jgi:hypothetical protein
MHATQRRGPSSSLPSLTFASRLGAAWVDVGLQDLTHVPWNEAAV